MPQHLSPKKVARAIGVSESSLKRWCDRGLVEFSKTAGGHRRIQIASVVEFLRDSKHRLVEPAVIGLPEGTGTEEGISLDESQRQFLKALMEPNPELGRRLVVELHLAGHPISRICDSVIKPTFHQLGERWECQEIEVFQERVACEIATKLLFELGDMIPAVESLSANVAIGAAPEQDGYTLPTKMVELVFRQLGWQALSLGSLLPFPTLLKAVEQYRPRLFWLSVSRIENETDFLNALDSFQRNLDPSIALVVGGRALTDSVRQRMRFAAYCDNLQQLESFAQSIAERRPAAIQVPF